MTPPLQMLERGCNARAGAAARRLSQPDRRLGAMNHAPTKNYPCEPMVPPQGRGTGAAAGTKRPWHTPWQRAARRRSYRTREVLDAITQDRARAPVQSVGSVSTTMSMSTHGATRRWYKGELHFHCERSTMPEMLAAYRRRRYDFCVSTEHDAVHQQAPYCGPDGLCHPTDGTEVDRPLLLVGGSEMSLTIPGAAADGAGRGQRPRKPVHVGAFPLASARRETCPDVADLRRSYANWPGRRSLWSIIRWPGRRSGIGRRTTCARPSGTARRTWS